PTTRQSTLGFPSPEPEIRAAEPARYQEVDVTPAIEPARVEPTMASAPPGLLSGYGEPPSALERSRSAMWPLALALVVGIALGFGAGYGVGRRDAVTTAAPPPTTSVPPPHPTPSGREFTETAVTDAPKPTATP